MIILYFWAMRVLDGAVRREQLRFLLDLAKIRDSIPAAPELMKKENDL